MHRVFHGDARGVCVFVGRRRRCRRPSRTIFKDVVRRALLSETGRKHGIGFLVSFAAGVNARGRGSPSTFLLFRTQLFIYLFFSYFGLRFDGNAATRAWISRLVRLLGIYQIPVITDG